MSSSHLAGPRSDARVPLSRSHVAPRKAVRRALPSTSLVDAAVSVLMLLAVISIFAVSSAMLTNWKIHYLTNGGGVLRKVASCDLCGVAAAGLLLVRNGDPFGEINRMLSQSRLVLVYLFCWIVPADTDVRAGAAIHHHYRHLPPAGHFLPGHLAAVGGAEAVAGMGIAPAILLNVMIGYYEYFSGHRLIPLTLGSVLVLGEWRARRFSAIR